MYHAHLEETGEKMKELESELRVARRSVDQLSQEYLEMWQRLEKLEILLFMQQNVISQLSLAVVDPVPQPLPFPSASFTGLTREDLYTPLSFLDTNPYLEDVYAITNHLLEDLDDEEQEQRAISFLNAGAAAQNSAAADPSLVQRSRKRTHFRKDEAAKEAQSWPSTPRHRSVLSRQEPEVRGSLEKTDSKESSDGRSIVLPPPVRTHLSRTLYPSKDESIEEMNEDLKDDSYLSPPSPPPPEPGHVPESIFSVSEYLEYRGESSSCVVISDSDLEDLDRLSYDLDVMSRENSKKKGASDSRRERRKNMSNERKRATNEIGSNSRMRRLEQRITDIPTNDREEEEEMRKLSEEVAHSILNRSSHSQATFAQISAPLNTSKSNWIAEKEEVERTLKREAEEAEQSSLLVDVSYKMKVNREKGREGVDVKGKVIEGPSCLPSTSETISSRDLRRREKVLQKQDEYDNLSSQLLPSETSSSSLPPSSSRHRSSSHLINAPAARAGDTIESSGNDGTSTTVCDISIQKVGRERKKSIKKEHEKIKYDQQKEEEQFWTGDEHQEKESERGRRTSLDRERKILAHEKEVEEDVSFHEEDEASQHPSQSDLTHTAEQVSRTGNVIAVVTSDTLERKGEGRKPLLGDGEKSRRRRMSRDLLRDEDTEKGGVKDDVGINQNDDLDRRSSVIFEKNVERDEKMMEVAQDQNELDQISAAPETVALSSGTEGSAIQNHRPSYVGESGQSIIDSNESPLSLTTTQGQVAQPGEATLTYSPPSVPVLMAQDGSGHVNKMMESSSEGTGGPMIGHGRGPIVTSEGIFSSLTTSMSKGVQSVFNVPGTPPPPQQMPQQHQNQLQQQNPQLLQQRTTSSSSGSFDQGFAQKSASALTSSIGGFFGGFGIKSSPFGQVRSQSVQQQQPPPSAQPQNSAVRQNLHQHSLPESVQLRASNDAVSISSSSSEVTTQVNETAASVVRRGSSTRRRHLNQSDRQQSIQSGDPSFPDETTTTSTTTMAATTTPGHVSSTRQYLTPNDGRKRGSKGEDVALGHLEQSLSEESGGGGDNSRQSSFMLSEYGSLEDPEAESEKRVRTSFPTDDDSAFCSTIEERALEEQSSNSISPLPASGHQNGHSAEMMTTSGQVSAAQQAVQQLMKRGNKEGDEAEKRDSVSSTSGGFQNRFASIMKQKVEERKTVVQAEEKPQEGEQEREDATDVANAEVSNATANSAGGITAISQESTESTEGGDADGGSKPVVGKKKWMVAVVRVFVHSSFLLLSQFVDPSLEFQFHFTLDLFANATSLFLI